MKVPGVEVALKADGLIRKIPVPILNSYEPSARKKFESTAVADVDGRFNLTSVMQAVPGILVQTSVFEILL